MSERLKKEFDELLTDIPEFKCEPPIVPTQAFFNIMEKGPRNWTIDKFVSIGAKREGNYAIFRSEPNDKCDCVRIIGTPSTGGEMVYVDYEYFKEKYLNNEGSTDDNKFIHCLECDSPIEKITDDTEAWEYNQRGCAMCAIDKEIARVLRVRDEKYNSTTPFTDKLHAQRWARELITEYEQAKLNHLKDIGYVK